MTHRSPNPRLRPWIVATLAGGFVLAAAAATADGLLSVHPGEPHSQDQVRILFRESLWPDTCPPVLGQVTVTGPEIEVVVVLDPDPPEPCVAVPQGHFYSVSAWLGPFDPGSYTVRVTAPSPATQLPETFSTTFVVREAVRCAVAGGPAATLLLPYFEVDLGDPDGIRTLVSLGTVANQATLAHLVVWSNWGWPVLSFDAVLPPHGAVSFDLGAILRGQWPDTSAPPGLYPSCSAPLARPEVDPAALQALLTGKPSPEDGHCYSEPGSDPALATGYLTVDVARDCAGPDLVSAQTAGYFHPETGIAASHNVLWGDYFYVDSAHDLAEGEALVGLTADADLYGVPGSDPGTSGRTFYRAGDDRRPLPHAMRGRFLDGGPFAADTELLIWLEGLSGPFDCEDPPEDFYLLELELFDQSGQSLAAETLSGRSHARRLRLGPDLPVSTPFGVVDASGLYFNGVIGVPIVDDLQTWMLPIVRAQGRFGVAARSVPIQDFCR